MLQTMVKDIISYIYINLLKGDILNIYIIEQINLA